MVLGMTDAIDTTSGRDSSGTLGKPAMGPAEELSAALRVAALRRTFWRSVLGHPPFLAAICELAGEVLSPALCPREALAAVAATAAGTREREAALDVLAEQLGRADIGAGVSDRILADLASIELGLTSQLCMNLRAPATGAAFFRYVTAVRRDYHALVTARQVLVSANQQLVVAIARRHVDGVMSLRDLIQAGQVGLHRAVDRFDVRKGLRFGTYAAWWIRRAIARALAARSRQGSLSWLRGEQVRQHLQ